MSNTIRDICSKNEAVITNLNAQAARAMQLRQAKIMSVKKEATKVINDGLPLQRMIMDFVEWDTNVLLVQHHRIKALGQYKNELVKFMIDKIKADDKLKELEEELEIKDDDLDRLNHENDALRKEVAMLERKIINQAPEKRPAYAPKEEKPKEVAEKRCERCGDPLKTKHPLVRFCPACKVESERESKAAWKLKYQTKKAKENLEKDEEELEPEEPEEDTDDADDTTEENDTGNKEEEANENDEPLLGEADE